MIPVKRITPIGEPDVIETYETGLICGGRPIAVNVKPLEPYINTKAVTLTSHSSRQVVQRTGSSTSITFSGRYIGQQSSVEIRYNGGAWTSATVNRSAGTWSCTMSLPSGQGSLEARLSGNDATRITLSYFGVGDVICIGGQSNGAGRGLSNQSYTHPTLKASRFNKAYVWDDLVDPTSDSTGALDSVLFDYDPSGMGSVWPLVATGFMAARGWPLGIVPSCKGGTGITLWTPPATPFDRTTLAGAMMHRARVTGAKLICWWQGEGGYDDVTGSSYYVPYMQLSAAVAANLPGVKMMPCKLQYCTAVTDPRNTNGWTAIQYIWDNDPNSVVGPTLASNAPPISGDLVTDDGFHLQSNVNLQAAADRWLASILAALPS